MIRYAVVILLMASSAFGQDAAQRRGLLFTRSSRTPVAQTAMSVRTGRLFTAGPGASG
jgi:hypothetical protein